VAKSPIDATVPFVAMADLAPDAAGQRSIAFASRISERLLT
jgi:hypothetical protein